MPVINDINWTTDDIIELQEHLDALPDNKARKRLLTEGYECSTFFAERYLDTLRHVHPARLVPILNRADVEIHRLPHAEAIELVKVITYQDITGDTAVGFRRAA